MEESNSSLLDKNSSPLRTSSKEKKLQEDKYDEYKDLIQDLYSKLTEFVDQHKLPDNLQLDTKKLDPENLQGFLNVLSTELLGEYIHIRNLSSKQLLQILMNYGCLYGRSIDENLQIKLADKCLFQDLPFDFEVPAKAIVDIEKPDIVAKEFNSLKQIELDKNGIGAVEFTQGIPIILNGSEDSTKKDQMASVENLSTKLLYGGYYHPKGTLILRSIFQELSEEAKNFFKEDENLTLDRIKEFFKIFGTLVPTEIVVGGELMRKEEIKQDTQVSDQIKEKNNKAKLVGLVQTWLLSIGMSVQKKEESKNSSDQVEQQLHFEANGGDEKYITDATKWINSLNNPDTWKVIRVQGWRYSYEYLQPKIIEKIKNIIAQARQEEISKFKQEAFNIFNYPLSSNILLETRAPYALCAIQNYLFAFFPHAMHILQLPNLDKSVKIPVPWKHVKSVTVIKDFIYASTSEGIFRINPYTSETTLVTLKDREIQMCLILSYGNYLYAFLDKVLKIDPETGIWEVFTSSNWDTACCGVVKKGVAYIVLNWSGNLWRLGLEDKSEKKIARSWGNSQAMISDPESENHVLVYNKSLYRVDINNGSYQQVEDSKYPNLICATMTGSEMYVATKADPYEKSTEKIVFYKVKPNGARDRINIEWSPFV